MNSNQPALPKKIELNIRDIVILVILILTSLSLYFTDTILSYFNGSDEELSRSREVSQSIANLSVEIDKISIDTSVLNNPFLRSVTSLPVYQLDTNSPLIFGKTNPFVGSYVVVATSTNGLGGIRYTNQTTASTTIITTTPTSTSTRR